MFVCVYVCFFVCVNTERFMPCPVRWCSPCQGMEKEMVNEDLISATTSGLKMRKRCNVSFHFPPKIQFPTNIQFYVKIQFPAKNRRRKLPVKKSFRILSYLLTFFVVFFGRKKSEKKCFTITSEFNLLVNKEHVLSNY